MKNAIEEEKVVMTADEAAFIDRFVAEHCRPHAVVMAERLGKFVAERQMALFAADDVILPIKLDYFSLSGVSELLRQIAGMHDVNPRLRVAGVLVTQYDGTTVANETLEALRESAVPIFGTCIHRTTAVDRAIYEHRPLRELPGSYPKRAADEYAAVVDEWLRGGAGNG